MSKFSQILKVAGIVAGVVVLGILVGWLGTRGTQPSTRPPEPPDQKRSVAEEDGGDTGNRDTNRLTEKRVDLPTVPPVNPPTNVVTSPVQGNLITNWEDRLNDILGSSAEDETAKAKQLMVMFPHLPEDGQIEVAQHLANLTTDKDFAPLGAYLIDPATPEPVVDVLMADLLNRPNAVKLPLLLGVAQSCPDHKTAEEAKEVLTLFLDEDYGTDWAVWQTKLQQWLVENPD
jgi:hypothetical protein